MEPSQTPKPKRDDVRRNGEAVRTAMLAFIKKEKRPPSTRELAEATGLSTKTVKAYRKRIKMGDGSKNVYQQLTNNVLMALYERATGYEHDAVKILALSQGKGEPSIVEEVPYTEHYPPDTAAAKLWMQLVEGFSEKTQHEHSGEVKNPGPPAIIQVQRYRPDDTAQ